MSNIIIPGTSLCAIVRDEMNNPSGTNPPGAIIDFVDSVMPYMEAGVIVETGSIDGTKEALQEIRKKYPHLEIFYRQFDNYASSRNFALDNVKTKRVFVFDADERLTREDFQNLYNLIQNTSALGYNFEFLDVYPNSASKGGKNRYPRLFELREGIKFKNILHEDLFYGRRKLINIPEVNIDTGISIKHFRPDKNAIKIKKKEWYGHVIRSMKLGEKPISPSQVDSFSDWKAYNPQREAFR